MKNLSEYLPLCENQALELGQQKMSAAFDPRA